MTLNRIIQGNNSQINKQNVFSLNHLRTSLSILTVTAVFTSVTCAMDQAEQTNRNMIIQDRAILTQSHNAYSQSLFTDIKKELSKLEADFNLRSSTGIINQVILLNNKISDLKNEINNDTKRLEQTGGINKNISNKIKNNNIHLLKLSKELNDIASHAEIKLFLADMNDKINALEKLFHSATEEIPNLYITPEKIPAEFYALKGAIAQFEALIPIISEDSSSESRTELDDDYSPMHSMITSSCEIVSSSQWEPEHSWDLCHMASGSGGGGEPPHLKDDFVFKVLCKNEVYSPMHLMASSCKIVSSSSSSQWEPEHSWGLCRMASGSGGGGEPPYYDDLVFKKLYNDIDYSSIDYIRSLPIIAPQFPIIKINIYKNKVEVANNCLPGVPEEILTHIFDYLDPKSKSKMGSTCLRMAAIHGIAQYYDFSYTFSNISKISDFKPILPDYTILNYKTKPSDFSEFNAYVESWEKDNLGIRVSKSSKERRLNCLPDFTDEIIQIFFTYLSPQDGLSLCMTSSRMLVLSGLGRKPLLLDYLGELELDEMPLFILKLELNLKPKQSDFSEFNAYVESWKKYNFGIFVSKSAKERRLNCLPDFSDEIIQIFFTYLSPQDGLSLCIVSSRMVVLSGLGNSSFADCFEELEINEMPLISFNLDDDDKLPLFTLKSILKSESELTDHDESTI